MPIYEYQCSDCGEKYEVLQRRGEPDEKQCKFCKGKINKLVSSTAFHLKGSGWYVTDYADKSKKTLPASSREATTHNEKETAPASKTDSENKNHNDAA